MCKDKVNVWQIKSHQSQNKSTHTHPTGHVREQVFLSKQAEDHATALESNLNHHFTCLHSNQRGKDPLGLLPGKLLQGISTAVLGRLCSPKVISILIPSKLELAYMLQHHAMCLGKCDFRKDEESILLEESILKQDTNCWSFHCFLSSFQSSALREYHCCIKPRRYYRENEVKAELLSEFSYLSKTHDCLKYPFQLFKSHVKGIFLFSLPL